MQHKNYYKKLRNLVLYLIVLFVIVDAHATGGGGKNKEELSKLLTEAKQLEQRYKEAEALKLYLQVLNIDSLNVKALCNASQLHSKMGGRYSHETGKLEHFRKAQQLAIRALATDSGSADAYFVMALATNKLATVNGLKQRMAVVPQEKKYLDQALALDSMHADAWHLLGRWHFKVANYNVAQVAASNMFFGGVPESASIIKAVEAFEMAIKLKPENLLYYYDLARVYLELKDHEACVRTLQTALDVNMITSEDLELNRRCKNLLQQLAKI